MNQLTQVQDNYFLFVLSILVINAVAKSVFNTKEANITKPVILLFSSLVVLIFWSFGAAIGKLFIFLFFAFGFWDWIGKYIERLFILLFQIVSDKAAKAWKRITTLYNK